MENLKKYVLLFFILTSASVFAQSQTSNSSIQEAANKGKGELIKILSQGNDFNFGVNSRELESAQVGMPIEEFSADFNKLASSTTQNLNNVVTRTERYIVPLNNDGKVVTTVTVAATPKGTKAVELVNRQYTSELNEMPRATSIKGLRIITVPNIDATIYVADDRAFTNYEGRNIKEPVSLTELTAQLQTDARAFEAKYGEALRKGKLVR